MSNRRAAQLNAAGGVSRAPLGSGAILSPVLATPLSVGPLAAMLDRGLTLSTDRFEATTPQEHFINERCFGEDFAEWLAAALEKNGVSVDKPIQEDWGWALIAKLDGHAFTIAIGIMDESIGSSVAEWRVGVSYERSQNGLAALFRKAPRESWQRMFAIVQRILEAEFGATPEPSPAN